MLVVTGCTIGGVAAIAASRLIGQVVYKVSPIDPVSFAIAIGSLLSVTIFACWLPARRAARVDPMRSLRGE